MNSQEFVLFALQITTMLGFAVLFGQIMRRLKQPAVLGEMIGGILLGPTIFGLIAPGLFGWLFQSSANVVVVRDASIKLGMLFFLFVAGLETNISDLKKLGRKAALIGFVGTAVPIGVGVALVYAIPRDFWGPAVQSHYLSFALFIGMNLANSANPVLARILMDLGLLNGGIGTLSMTATIVDDLINWTLFAIILSDIAPSGQAASTSLPVSIALVILVFILILGIGRWLGPRSLRWIKGHVVWSTGFIAVTALLVLLAASITEGLGIHAFLGAFLVGAALGGQGDEHEEAHGVISHFALSFFAPIFFISMGMTTNYITNFDLGLVMLILVVALGSKLFGVLLGAKLAGMRIDRDAWAIAFGLNARGATGIILAGVGLKAGVIDERIFVAIVVMCLGTSLLAGPVMNWLLSHRIAAVQSVTAKKLRSPQSKINQRLGMVILVSGWGQNHPFFHWVGRLSMSSTYVETRAALARPKTFPPEVSLPWSLPANAVLEALESDSERGLTSAEADRRLHHYGPNVIQEAQPKPFWRRYWEQLTGDAVVRLLLIGGIVSLLLGDYLEGVSIILMLNIMASFGLWQEGRATDAARALREADDPLKLVIRDGYRVKIPASLIVPGDVVYLPTGAIAPADGRAIAAVNAEKDTSKLTGESHAVRLKLAPVAPTTVVNEQKNMLHRGDALLSGNVTMIVTATGSLTEVGKIATRLTETVEVKTPLDEQLDDLGNAMTKIFLWLALSVIGVGLLREFYTIRQTATPFTLFKLLIILKEAFVNAVALIIAAIPEGLPAVLSITLAIATKVMVRRNALVRKPKAVEGSGSMTVLLTDKTGTLTANQMTVTHLYLDGQTIEADGGEVRQIQDSVLLRAVQIARKCNNNSDSTEAALLRWVEQLGFEAVGDIETRAVEHVFDQTLKRMTTVHESDREGYYHIFTKGAPEQVLQLCHQIHLGGENIPLDGKQEIVIREAITSLASRGLRVIALADRLAQHAPTLRRDQAETELVFVGLLGIMDPPRADVASAVAQLAAAGVRSVMVTGDNPVTAYHIAKTVGIVQQDMPVRPGRHHRRRIGCVKKSDARLPAAAAYGARFCAGHAPT